MKHNVKIRSQAYYPNVYLLWNGISHPTEEDVYSRLIGTVIKTTAHSVWIEEDPKTSSNWKLRARVSRANDLPDRVISKWMLKDNGLWHLVGSKGSARQINFKLDPLMEFTFG